ncbi:unnamed protein product, partial [Cyprideis torosa]
QQQSPVRSDRSGGRRLRLRGLTWVPSEGAGLTQQTFQTKEDPLDSSLKGSSSTNHIHGSTLTPPTASPPKKTGLRDRIF